MDKKDASKIRFAPDEIYNYVLSLYQLSKYKELQTELDISLEKYPQDIRLLSISGIYYFKSNNFNKSIISYEQALEIDPFFTDALNNLGVALKTIGEYDRAIEQYKKVIAIKPTDADAHNNIGNVYLKKGNFESAAIWFKKAVGLNSIYPEAFNNLGLAYKGINNLKAAIANFQNALKLKPRYPDALLNLGTIYQAQNKHVEAITCYDEAVNLDRSLELAIAHKLHQQATICDWEGIARHKDIIPDLGVKEAAVTPFAMLYLEDNPKRHLIRSNLYARSQFAPPIKHATDFKRPNTEKRTIKLGYFSGEFHSHPVMHLVSKMFDLHDKTQFDLTAFSVGPVKTDLLRVELQNKFNTFHDVESLSDSEIAQLARQDKIDIAIDLSGFTKCGRPGIFRLRAAPVQVSYLGYPGTMGDDIMDYLVADETLIPPEYRQYYAEKIIYMPVSYQVSDDSRQRFDRNKSRAELGFKEDEVIFCCFNNLTKISQKEFDIWIRLLQKLSNTRLWLVNSSDHAKNNLMGYLRRHNIDDRRILFSDYCSYPEYLKNLTAADLFLDTFNFNAGATANDALWSGLPVLTKIGKGYTSRMASSLLKALSMEELITNSETEYESLAINLGSDPKKLTDIRKKLNGLRKQSNLFNTRHFTKNLESAYSIIHDRFSKGIPPEDVHFDTDFVQNSNQTSELLMKKFLHVGCGRHTKINTTPGFINGSWQEVRLDIDEAVNPDILSSVLELDEIESESFDSVFTSHNIEHVYTHQIPIMLTGFLRILKGDGYVVITCPNVLEAARLIRQDKLTEPAYISPAGPITPLDIMYGHTEALKSGNEYMGHKTGFTPRSLGEALISAGFKTVALKAPSTKFDMWAIAAKTKTTSAIMEDLVAMHVPGK